jgi:site-specific recombinase XerC
MSNIILSDESTLTENAQNPAMVYISSLSSQRSQRVMKNALRTIVAILIEEKPRNLEDAVIYTAKWPELRYHHTQSIRAQLIQSGKSASSINRMLSALRGVLKECWRLGHMSAEEYQRAVDIKNIKSETVPAGRDMAQGEILALVNACTDDKNIAGGIRDAAIMGILYTCALRRAEVVALDVEHFEAASGRIIVHGKGNNQRTVYVTGGTLEALTDWLQLRGNEPGALFFPVNKGGNIVARRRITAQAIYTMLRRRAKQANVTNLSPHDFRRTFAGDLLDRGTDIVTVQKLMGHASPVTTSRYDRRGERVKQDAISKLHYPYKSKDVEIAKIANEGMDNE